MEAATATETVKFISKFPNLRIVLFPEAWDKDAQGRVTKKHPGRAVQFENYMAEVSPEIAEELRQKTTAADTVAALYGRDFWESSNVPGQLYPTVDERKTQILRAAAKQQKETIGEILDAERESHNRPEVMDYGLEALASLEE